MAERPVHQTSHGDDACGMLLAMYAIRLGQGSMAEVEPVDNVACDGVGHALFKRFMVLESSSSALSNAPYPRW